MGFDSVDVAACTAADVALFITAGAVDHSVAEATAGWMLALTHHMRTKDALVRTWDWDARSRYMGSELRDRTLGLVGFGGIGRAVVKVLTDFACRRPWSMTLCIQRSGCRGWLSASLTGGTDASVRLCIFALPAE